MHNVAWVHPEATVVPSNQIKAEPSQNNRKETYPSEPEPMINKVHPELEELRQYKQDLQNINKKQAERITELLKENLQLTAKVTERNAILVTIRKAI